MGDTPATGGGLASNADVRFNAAEAAVLSFVGGAPLFNTFQFEGHGGGVKLRAYFTPGHEDDHVCYYMAAEKVVFSGDTILGNSSSSVRNLKQYMASLDTLARLKPDMICPGHGQIINNGTARVNGYIRHRTERESQVLAALASGMESVGEIVSAVYPRNLRRNLRSAAARNVRTHLGKLTEDGRVTESEATYTVTND